jgi:hypothetical protein
MAAGAISDDVGSDSSIPESGANVNCIQSAYALIKDIV